MLKGHYLKGSLFFEYKLTSRCYLAWKGILKVLLKRVCFKLVDGFSINPWSDLWVPNLSNGIVKAKDGVVDGEWQRVVEFGH